MVHQNGWTGTEGGWYERGFAEDYDIEGSDVGYRWFAREGYEPLFRFGHGLR